MKRSLQGLCKKAFTGLISLFILSTLLTMPAHPGEFDFSEENPTEVVVLPGTNMKGGMFTYVFDELIHGKMGKTQTRKAGVLVDNSVLYYVDTGEKGYSFLDPGGDCNFGVYDKYFLMDCWSFGSVSGHNRIMYLFRVGKDTVELLDVIGEAFVGGAQGSSSEKGIAAFIMGDMHAGGVPGMDFDSDVPEANKPGFQRFGYRLPLWMEIKDTDNDGVPEVKISIYMLDKYVFDLYLEIKDDHLHVDLNPALYRPLFDAEKKKNRSKRKTVAYCVYGYLSGELGLQRIKASRPKRDDYNISILIEKKGHWDEAFHFDGVPELKRYEIRRRGEDA